jgi:hypothetical protein
MRFYATWTVLAALFLVLVPYPGPGAPECLAQISITSPNGGEVWTAGTTNEIRWTPYPFLDGTARLYLLRAGKVEEYLGETDFGWQFSWTICEFVGDGTEYGIRIICDDCNPPVQDDSDGYFSITGSTPLPGMTVTSPSDGESWSAGTTHAITWNSVNPRGYLTAWLIQPARPNVVLGHVPVSSGALQWDIDPFLGDGDDFHVHLSWEGYCGPRVDVDTPGSFAVTGSSPLPTLAVTSPIGGEAWPADSVQSITWDSNDPAGTVDVWLTAGVSYYEYLGSAPMADGHFDWPVAPCGPDGTDYRILLRWSSHDRSVEARSPATFSVTGSTTPSLTITSPSGGEHWAAGTSHAITWTCSSTNGNAAVSLEGNAYAGLAHVPAAAGSVTWDIPPGIGNGTYTIRLSMDTCPVQTVSSAFYVTGSITPTLTLTTPAGGTNWTAGTLGTITWQSTGITGLLDIYLPDDGLHQSGHVSVPVSDGSFTWPIPPTLVWPPDPNAVVLTNAGVWLWAYDCGILKYARGQAIRISPGTALFGDFDADSDVDLPDMGVFQAAFTGRGPLFLDSPADFFDFEPDGDVDVDDLDVMAAGLTGPAGARE